MMEKLPMRLVASDGAPPYYVFEGLDPAGAAVHGVFTRRGGTSVAPYASLNVSSSIGDDPIAVDANRARVLAALGRPRAGLVMAGLVHGAAVARVGAAPGPTPPTEPTGSTGALDGGGRYAQGVDALVTDDPDATLVITAADCAQALFVDPRRRAVGIAHAGWRGTVAGVLTATVAAMRAHFGSDPADLRAAVGPCLGPCCAQFSDPHRELPAWCAPFILGGHGGYVDLWAMNRAQLRAAGIPDAGITVAEVCTVCRRDEFYSHRGDHGRTGRFAAAIGLRRRHTHP